MLKQQLLLSIGLLSILSLSTPVGAGQQAFVDPATGKLTSTPSPEQVNQAAQQQAQAVKPAPVQTVFSDGSAMISGPFMVDVTATVDEHGKVHISETGHSGHADAPSASHSHHH